MAVQFLFVTVLKLIRFSIPELLDGFQEMAKDKITKFADIVEYSIQRCRIYKFFFFNSTTAKFAARAVNAMYVNEGFTQEEETIAALSVTKTFLQACT